MNIKTLAVALCLVTVISGCAMDNPPYSETDYTIVGGAIGGVAGVGTSLALSEAGVIGTSAALGGLIGIPVGAVIGYEIASSANNSDIAIANRAVDQNASLIEQRNLEIKQLRHQVVTEEPTEENDAANASHVYEGPQLGN